MSGSAGQWKPGSCARNAAEGGADGGDAVEMAEGLRNRGGHHGEQRRRESLEAAHLCQ